MIVRSGVLLRIRIGLYILLWHLRYWRGHRLVSCFLRLLGLAGVATSRVGEKRLLRLL